MEERHGPESKSVRASSFVLALRWPAALAAGGAIWCSTRAPIAAFIVSWYVFELLALITLIIPPQPPQTAMTRVLVRAAGSAVSFAVAYLVLVPWKGVIALAYLLLVSFEAVYHLVFCGRRARAAVAARPVSGLARDLEENIALSSAHEPYPGGLRIPTLLCALLFVLILPPTAALFAGREVVLDTRFYMSQLERPGIYNEALRLAGNVAMSAARAQGPTVQRAVTLLSEEDVRQAAELLLPKEWTEAVIEQALDATLSWLRADNANRVPALSLPIQDVKRHALEAASLMLDRHMAALPLCTSETSSTTICRPNHESAAAYAADRKPRLLGIVEDAFALYPGEVDLATVVTMAPGQLREPLDTLAKARALLQTVDRSLGVAGLFCLSLLVSLTFLAAVDPRGAAGWVGGAFLAAATGTWAGTRALPVFAPEAILARLGPEGILESPTPMSDWALDAMRESLQQLHTLLAPWAFCLAGIGLALLLTWGLVLRSRARPLTGLRTGRDVAILLALAVLAWTTYLRLGRDLVEGAIEAHRRGDAGHALILYRQAERAYPFAVDGFVEQARQGTRECARFLAAESAYRRGAQEEAVWAYEALLVGTPALALQEGARDHLLASLHAWGKTLEEAGERERALDRYRFIRDEYRDPEVHQEMTGLYVEWGKELADEADYLAAIATYRRIPQEVADPRLWTAADDYIVDAYCVYSASARAAGDVGWATALCREVSAELPSLAAERCPRCVE